MRTPTEERGVEYVCRAGRAMERGGNVQKGAGGGGGGGGSEGAFGTMKETKGRQERQTKPCGRVRPMSLLI